uniref:hypothetical protein n=2 Tax=Bacteria TaxID=2 RepID=UPI00352B265B
IDIPQGYSEILITKEVPMNIRNHADKTLPVKFNISRINQDYLTIHIENKITPTPYKNSNGEGLKCLGWLRDFEPFGFGYESKEDHTTFFQTLTFKVNEH